MSTLTLEHPIASTGSAGGRVPPRPPDATASAAASGPSESPTVLKRSFSFMPARLSPVKRGEIRVPRPPYLQGTGDRGFAFHPTDESLAPAGMRDQFYAYTAPAKTGELILAVTQEGRATVGLCTLCDETEVRIQNGSAVTSLTPDAIAETAIVVGIDMAR